MNMLRERRKMEYTNCCIKIQKAEKSEDRKEAKYECSEQKTVTNMADIIPTISILTSNVNSLNIPIKAQRLSQEIQKQDATLYCL